MNSELCLVLPCHCLSSIVYYCLSSIIIDPSSPTHHHFLPILLSELAPPQTSTVDRQPSAVSSSVASQAYKYLLSHFSPSWLLLPHHPSLLLLQLLPRPSRHHYPISHTIPIPTPIFSLTPFLTTTPKMAPMDYAVCSFIPPHMLASILQSEQTEHDARDATQHTITQTDDFRLQRRPDLGQGDPAGYQGIIPPHMTSHIAQQSDDQDSSEFDEQLRAARAKPGGAAAATTIDRRVHTCNGSTRLPGTLIRAEGQNPIGTRDTTRDPDECYDGFGATYNFFQTVLGRNGIDNKGARLVGSVHYSTKYNNAMWNGRQMIFGDGDGVIFNGFTDELDVIGHELGHGVTQYTANLAYQGESGALNESASDVYGIMIKQYQEKQSSAQSNWLIGEGILAKGINGVALRSMKAPGTAYDDPRLGKDPQPDHYDRLVVTLEDNGGVHINSGIPNKAFYLAAIALGGNSWDRAGKIWYRTLSGGKLPRTASFQQFANLTAADARTLYNADVQRKVIDAWAGIGITVARPQSSAAEL